MSDEKVFLEISAIKEYADGTRIVIKKILHDELTKMAKYDIGDLVNNMLFDVEYKDLKE
jgi:hypothetical protein